MHCHGKEQAGLGTNKIVLVGNPNVGKSVIFGSLTGKYATVSNYPGTTVEITLGEFHLGGGSRGKYTLIDTPGTNSLLPSSDDERVTRNVILEEKPGIIIQVGDMKNLRRTLHLNYQIRALAGTKTPMILVLNMEDEARRRGIVVDAGKLQSMLSIPVIVATAVKKEGINELLAEIRALVNEGGEKQHHSMKKYSADIEEAIRKIQGLLKDYFPENSRGMAELVLRRDSELLAVIRESSSDEIALEVSDIISATQEKHVGRHLNLIMTRELDEEVKKIVAENMTRGGKQRRSIGSLLDAVCLNPVTGIPIFFLVITLVFYFVGIIGAGEIVNFFESVVFGVYVNPFIAGLVNTVPIPIIHELLVGDYGVITFGLTYAIAIVFPVVTAFFIAFAILEDSGYLPRLAFLGDKLFRQVGLNGKAVLPLVLGTGCDTMATMTTRILETRKERVIATMMLALGVPCSAQLAVLFGILTFVSPVGALVVFGVVFSQLLLVAWLMKIIFPGEKSDFIMELPPLRIPNLTNIIIKTWSRVEWFLREAIPLFVIGTLVISFMNLFTLFEIIQYLLILTFIFVAWKSLVTSSRKTMVPELARNHSNAVAFGAVLPATFFALYLSGILGGISEVIVSLLPGFLSPFQNNLLEVIIESSRPVVVLLLGLPPDAAVMYILGFLRRDYGAAGFFQMATEGVINGNQIVVGTIVLTLFVPCVAQLLVMVKEHGYKTAIGMVVFIIPFAFLVGGVVNFLLVMSGVLL
ncbi:MAG: ferrous iron transport protein B [Candidatus Hodarchaeales archaeon]|jgi:ferrous iron transport protein B